MTVGIVGGIDRLESHYRRTAGKRRVRLKIFSRHCPKLGRRLESLDGIVLFTGEVSHDTARCAKKVAKDRNLPLICSHTSSLTALEESISKLKEGK